MSRTRFQGPPAIQPDQLFPGCILVAGDLNSPLPLEHTAVNAEITGPLAEVTVTQRFSNPLKEPAELTYLFPLPHTAALSSFEVRLPNRSITGSLEELEKARREYEEAVQQGHQAGLVEQRLEGLYSVSLANVQPGETIHTIFRYRERIKFDDNAYEFIFPMGLTPKYHSPAHPEEGDGVDAPLAQPGERIGDVTIEVLVKPGLPYGDPLSPSHNLAVEETRDGSLRIYLASPCLPDHDFVLRLPVTLSSNLLTAWRTQDSGGDIFLAVLQPPDSRAEQAAPLPRQFIFVLDRSGSMSGQPIAQARNALRACLRTLNPGDEFALQFFDNVVEWYKPVFAPVTQAEIDAADRHLSMVEGRGGTEIVEALHQALSFGQVNPEKMRFIVFLTDGAVSASERALQEIARLIGAARLFTFGIGPSVNRPLLSRIASLGRGTSEFLQLDEDIEGAIIRFQDRLAFPALTDLTLSAENAKIWDIYPSPLPDAYVGQPVVVSGRIKSTGRQAARLTLSGRRAGQPVQVEFGLPQPQESPAVVQAWAQARLDALIEQSQREGAKVERLRREIISHALEYHLVSPHTAFVAVDRDSRVSNGKPRKVRISQPLPQGLDIAGFGGGGTIRRSIMMNASASAPAPQAMSGRKSARMDMDYSLAEPSDLNLPGFMRKRTSMGESAPTSQPASPQDLLRLLARTQELEGSWEADVERTAIALLCFLRQGQTASRGTFRVAVQRAAAWLGQNPASGVAELIRVTALVEMKRSLGETPDTADPLDWVKLQFAPTLTPQEEAILIRLLAGEPLSILGSRPLPPKWDAIWQELIHPA